MGMKYRVTLFSFPYTDQIIVIFHDMFQTKRQAQPMEHYFTLQQQTAIPPVSLLQMDQPKKKL
jgi:hypothetical protein